MGWFSNDKPAVEGVGEGGDWPPPTRSASDEYLEGLKYAASVYEERASWRRNEVKDRLGAALKALDDTSWNGRSRISSDLTSSMGAWDIARDAQGTADEIRECVRQFEFQGLRPPHLPPLPPDPTPHQSGE